MFTKRYPTHFKLMPENIGYENCVLMVCASLLQSLNHMNIVRAPSEEIDQPAHSRSLIRIFTGRTSRDTFSDEAVHIVLGYRIWELCINGLRKSVAVFESYELRTCAQRGLRSACAFAQSDQNLHWAHIKRYVFWRSGTHCTCTVF